MKKIDLKTGSAFTSDIVYNVVKDLFPTQILQVLVSSESPTQPGFPNSPFTQVLLLICDPPPQDWLHSSHDDHAENLALVQV